MSLELLFYNIALKEYVYLLAPHFIPVVSTLHYKAQPSCFFAKSRSLGLFLRRGGRAGTFCLIALLRFIMHY